MQTEDMQDLLLSIMPQWYCYIAKPFKALLAEDVSLNMYYCIRILGVRPNLTMSELARWMQISKQQMTKLVDRMIVRGFVERVSDPDDRRIIRLQLTDHAQEYSDRFLMQDAAYYRNFFDSMPEDDRAEFAHALESIRRVFIHLNEKNLKTEGESIHD